jgi:hypothetical protein
MQGLTGRTQGPVPKAVTPVRISADITNRPYGRRQKREYRSRYTKFLMFRFAQQMQGKRCSGLVRGNPDYLTSKHISVGSMGLRAGKTANGALGQKPRQENHKLPCAEKSCSMPSCVGRQKPVSMAAAETEI